MGGRSAGDDEPPGDIQEWRLHPSYSINGIIPIAVAIAIAAFGISMIGSGAFAGMVAVFVLSLALAAWGLRNLRRQASVRVALTTHEVISKNANSIDRTLLADISGVAVIKRSLTGDTWSTWLITAQGTAIRLAAPAFVFLSRHKSLVVPDDTYWDSVANSPSGLQATAIYAACRRAQADEGPLASAASLAHQMSKVRSLDRAGGRFWSPTGETSAG